MLTYREIGQLGEEVIAKWFQSKGSIVKIAKQFDDKKDMTIDGVSTEIKTQSLYRSFPFPGKSMSAFTVPILADNKLHTNQLSKCMNVPQLIFVQRPTLSDPVVRLYRAPEPGHRPFTIIQNSKDGRYVAGLKHTLMTEIAQVEDKNIVQKLMDNWR